MVKESDKVTYKSWVFKIGRCTECGREDVPVANFTPDDPWYAINLCEKCLAELLETFRSWKRNVRHEAEVLDPDKLSRYLHERGRGKEDPEADR